MTVEEKMTVEEREEKAKFFIGIVIIVVAVIGVLQFALAIDRSQVVAEVSEPVATETNKPVEAEAVFEEASREREERASSAIADRDQRIEDGTASVDEVLAQLEENAKQYQAEQDKFVWECMKLAPSWMSWGDKQDACKAIYNDEDDDLIYDAFGSDTEEVFALLGGDSESVYSDNK